MMFALRPFKVLIVRLSAHGDVLQTLPLLARLKHAYPHAEVGWVVESAAAPLLQGHPLIDHLHVICRKQWQDQLKCRGLPALFDVVSAFQQTLGEIKAVGYDVSLDVQGLQKSALWPAMAGVPRRVGYQRSREGASMWYNQWVARHDLRDARQHTADVFSRVLAPLFQQLPPLQAGNPDQLFPIGAITPSEDDHVATLLAKVGRTSQDVDRPLVVLAPATRWASKIWPLAHWQALVAGLAPYPIDVALVASPQEAEWEAVLAPLADDAQLGARALSLVGKTSLRDLFPLLSRARVLVGPDSLPMHVAQVVTHQGWGVAPGLPHVVGLFGPTSAARTGPTPAEAHSLLSTALPCQPCFERTCPLKHHRCLNDLTPQRVLEAVLAQLAITEQPSASLPYPAVSLTEEA